MAFVGANLGALEILGMGANAAQYGILQAHFYWIGAVPAMIFVAIFMMPFYYGSKAHSVPGFLKLRYNEATRGFNAFSFAVLTLLTSSINMYAAALVFNLLLGWSLNACILLSALFINGMAGNVTAFNTVWTYDIYRSYIRRDAPDSHYLWMGRVVTVIGLILSIGTAYIASSSSLSY